MTELGVVQLAEWATELERRCARVGDWRQLKREILRAYIETQRTAISSHRSILDRGQADGLSREKLVTLRARLDELSLLRLRAESGLVEALAFERQRQRTNGLVTHHLSGDTG